MRKHSIFIFTILFIPLQNFAVEVSLPHYLNFDGQLLDNSNNPIGSATSVTFEIYDPSGTCLLYDETQTITPDANGEFSTKIGPATGNTSSSNDGNLSWEMIFKNDGQLRGIVATYCPAGYNPAANHGRKLRVTIGANPALTPDYTLAPVPMATVAETLQGKRAADFILANPSSFVSTHNGDFQLNNQSSLNLGNAVNPSTNYVSIQAPAAFSSYTLTLPIDDGTAGQVLSTDGNGVLSWIAPGGGGAVTSVFGRTGAVTSANGDYSATQISNTAAGTIAAADVQAALNELDAEKLSTATGSVTSSHLLDGTVAAVDLATGSVDSNKIADGTITNVDVAGSGISVDKIANAIGAYLAYQPNNTPCANGQVLKWNNGSSRWECGTDNDLSNTKVSLAGDTMTGNLTMNGQSQVRFGDSSSTNFVTIRAPTSVITSYILNLPNMQGGFGDVLTNDGAGNLSWTNPAGQQVIAASMNVAANPDITFISDMNTGFFNPAADHIAVSTNGIERMRIDQIGNIGIGMNAPGAKLDVQSSNSTLPTLYVSKMVTSSAPTLVIDNSNTASVIADFRHNSLSKMHFRSTGIGIGTTNPVGDLDVNITGVLRLKKQASGAAPTIGCSTINDGAVALTNTYVLCVCNGPASTWYRASDGTTNCTW